MSEAEFFDELYDQHCVAFPCYALLKPNGGGFVAEGAADGTAALVVLTDEDLMRRYRRTRRGRGTASVTLATPDDLAVLVAGLPRQITHVTFDPCPAYHRRYPVAVIRASLAQPAK